MRDFWGAAMFKASVVKLVLFFQIAVISLLMLSAAYVAFDAIRNFRAAHLAVGLVDVDKSLFLGALGIRSELTPTQNALQTSEAPQQIVADIRRQGAEKFGLAVAALKTAPIAGRQASLVAVEDDWSNVLRAQGDVDADAAKPLVERDIARVEPWRTAVIKLADDLMTAGNQVSNAVRLTDPVLGELVQIRRLAWRLRDAYGGQCILLRIPVARNQALNPILAAAWNQHRGNYMAAWSDLEVLMSRPAFPVSLSALANAAHDAIVSGQDTIDRMVASLGSADKTAPSSAAFSAACVTSSSVIELAFRVLAEATERAATLQRTAIVEIAVVLAMSAMALVSILYSLLALRRRFTKPIGGLTQAIGRLSRRDFEEPVAQTGFPDEIGAMAQALDSLRQSAQNAKRLERQAKDVHDRELTRSRGVDEACRKFEDDTFATLSIIGQAGELLTSTSINMRNLAAESSERARTAAENAAEVTTNVQTVAAATEELSTSITDITSRASAGARNVQQAVLQADDTRRTVDALNAAVQKIGEVVALINGIASQTNLLALNATIEAARAGETGKGFAVVAGEVKSLANQTARATEDISRQIEEVQAAMSNAVAAIGTMGETITHINEAVAAIAEAAEQQQQATQEISASIQKAARNTQLVTEDVAQVAQSNQRTGEAAAGVMQSVSEQQKEQDLLKSTVETFISRVKSI